MKNRLKSLQLTWPVVLILWLSAFTIYRSLLSHVLFYYDQHHLFIYTHQYVAHTVQSKGVTALMCEFLGQFFHLTILGSIILATMLAAICLFADFFLKRLSRAFSGKMQRYGMIARWLRWLQVPLAVALVVFFTFSTSNDTPAVLVWTFIVTAVLAFVALFIGKKTETADYGRKPLIVGAICAVLLFIIAGYQFRQRYSIPERIMLKTEQYAEAGAWDDVDEYTAAYLRSGHDNLLIAYYRTMALGEKKQLAEAASRALQGSQDPADYYLLKMGEKAFFFPWNSNSREAEYGGLVYERLGLINEAQHWETEALQVFGLTAPHLLRLAEYAIATGRPDVAEHFLEPLRHTLYYRDRALELENIEHDGKVDGLPDAFAKLNDSAVTATDSVAAKDATGAAKNTNSAAKSANDAAKGNTGAAPFSNVFHLAPQLDYALSIDSTNALAREYRRALELVMVQQ